MNLGSPVSGFPSPDGFKRAKPTDDPDDEQDHPLPSDRLVETIRGAKGRTLLPETTAGSYGDKGAALPRRDFEPQRLGADPPQDLIQLRQQVECTVSAATAFRRCSGGCPVRC